jgi:hypothetical protein
MVLPSMLIPNTLLSEPNGTPAPVSSAASATSSRAPSPAPLALGQRGPGSGAELGVLAVFQRPDALPTGRRQPDDELACRRPELVHSATSSYASELNSCVGRPTTQML